MSRYQKSDAGRVSGTPCHRSYAPINIPTNEGFLEQWYYWVHKKVARHFKHNRDRIADTAQDVRLRLLAKDFIARWFFKHLSDELVDLAQASRILGGAKVTIIGDIQPADIPDAACSKPRCARRHRNSRRAAGRAGR